MGAGMIHETSLEIGDLYKRWQVELESRHARRNKVHYIDQLLNELELLNLAEATTLPDPLRAQVQELLDTFEHNSYSKSGQDLTIARSMEALYDIQDTLLLGGEEGDEAL
jgi:hypothetical protein